ncbi:MAG: class I SAM-dependent methyltransferase [Rhodobacteraceae bacterium]|nr:class I SAM-dependent methyltransferase [Paracoccaceae bacterium]
MDKPDLSAAYALNTPDDSRALYARWAETYDSGFIAENHYILHLAVARAFADAGGAGPVLDVGAGTGICGEALAALDVGPVDATDISAEMLTRAQAKGVYRATFVADVTRPLDLSDAIYRGVVSSGTFTTGHVGPDAIDELLRVASPGALFALSINARHFAAAGFEAKLQSLSGRIRDLRLPEVAIYGPGAQGDHREDTALIALFGKA